MSKRSKTILYMFCSLAALFGLFMLWATSDIPLPSNAKKEGSTIRIDISAEAKDEREIKESLFIVPNKFRPKVSEGAIVFYFKFPDGIPYSGNDSPIPPDSIKVNIIHHSKPTALRSEYMLRQTQSNIGELKKFPYVMERRDRLEIYRVEYGSDIPYYNFVAKDGSNVLAQDWGDGFRDYIINRKLSSHIEIEYLLSKHLVRDTQHFVEDITAIDNVVLNLVRSFQVK